MKEGNLASHSFLVAGLFNELVTRSGLALHVGERLLKLGVRFGILLLIGGNLLVHCR